MSSEQMMLALLALVADSGGVSSGTGGGDASAANQEAQITLETAIRDRLSSLLPLVDGIEANQASQITRLLEIRERLPSTLSLFGNLRVVNRTPQIELRPNSNLSNLRDVVYDNGVELANLRTSTKYSRVNGEHRLQISGATDNIVVESAEYGRYQPGYTGDCGIGVRLPVALTGNQVARWGYFHVGDGFFFQYDPSGLSLGIRKGGVDTLIPRSQWNRDKVDGTGPSGLTLDLARGALFEVAFGNSYGSVAFQVAVPDANNFQRIITLHTAAHQASAIVNDLSLPIRVGIANNGTAAAQEIFFSTRYFSILGHFNPFFRTNGHSRTGISVPTTGWTPLLTFRRKAGFNSIPLFPDEYSVICAGADIRLRMLLNPALSGTLTWIAPDGVDPAETICEVCETVTGLTGGDVVWKALHTPGNSQIRSLGQSSVHFEIPRQRPLVLAAQAIGATATVSIVKRWKEEW